MGGIASTRDAAIESIRKAFPDMRVMAVSGSSSAASILKQAIGAEAVFVMALGAENVADRDTLLFDVSASFAAIAIVHGRTNAESREDAGLPVAEAVALHIHGNDFEVATASPARVSGILPINDEELSSKGLWAWTITWDQRLILEH